MKIPLAILVTCLSISTGAWAQTQPDPSVKTGDGKAAQAKPAKTKSDKSPCAGMQGGVDASGGESVEQHSKASAGSSAACGKHNGKADQPEAAPTTANPQNDPVTRK